MMSRRLSSVVKTNKATACAVKRGELERDGPTPWALSKFVHSTTQAKRPRGTATSEEDELDAVMAAAEKLQPPV